MMPVWDCSGGFSRFELKSELEMIDLNIRALFFLTKTYGARMVKRGGGGIINLASLAAFNPYPGMAVYTASKSFVLNYTLAISEELRSKGVRVMALCPGSTSSEFFNASTAGAKTKFFKMAGVLPPAIVAKEALQSFEKGKQICIPGRLNKFMKVLTGLMPTGIFMKMIHEMMKEFD
jgi:short-subunit dehydrogenase